MKSILDEYDAQLSNIVAYSTYLHILCRDLLESSGIRVHKIEYRAKDRASLSKKIAKPEKDYQSLTDVTDLCGIRIITYLSTDVDKVADIIENEFEIDSANSTDKRKILAADKFGYLSLHYIAQLSKSRSVLREYNRYAGLKAEIQIRSVIQHAWAEIEHDIGYKSENAIPDEIKRRFYRLAALLELADLEFVGVTNDIVNYNKKASGQIASNQLTEISINKDTLRLFIRGPVVREFEEKMAKKLGAKIEEQDELSEFTINASVELGLRSIFDIEKAYLEERETIGKWISDWLSDLKSHKDKGKSLCEGVTLLYLFYSLFAKRGDKAFFMDYLMSEKSDLGLVDSAFVDRVFESYLKHKKPN